LIEVEHVRGALDKYGANLNITFSCDRVERQLSRIQKLADMASSKKFTLQGLKKPWQLVFPSFSAKAL
jgi:hypothetical protein